MKELTKEEKEQIRQEAISQVGESNPKLLEEMILILETLAKTKTEE